MEQIIFEGPWEEVRAHDAELIGQHVRLIVVTNSQGSGSTVEEPMVEEQGEQPTLDRLFAGRTRRVSFGPSDLARNSEQAFGEIMSRKHAKQQTNR